MASSMAVRLRPGTIEMIEGPWARVLLFLVCMTAVLDVVFPSKGVEVERGIPLVVKGLVLGMMSLYVAWSAMFAPRVRASALHAWVAAFGVVVTISALAATSQGNEVLGYWLRIVYWLVAFVGFHQMATRGSVTRRDAVLVFLVGFFCYFLSILRDFADEALYEGAKEFFVSNNSYRMLAFLVGCMLLKSTTARYLLLMLGAVGCTLALKRGAMIVCVVLILAFLVRETRNLHGRLLPLVGMILTASAVGIGIAGFVIANLDVFLMRMADLTMGDRIGSGRGLIYSVLLGGWAGTQSAVNFLFGFGLFSSVEVLEESIGVAIYAHSDVVEFIHGFGLLGGILLAALFGVLLGYARVLPRRDGRRFAFVLAILMIGLQSLYSNVIFTSDFIPFALLFAVVLGSTAQPVLVLRIPAANSCRKPHDVVR